MQDKSTISKIVYIVLAALLALGAVFGYDIGVIQPREAAQAGGSSRAAGVNVRTEKALAVANDVTVGGALTVGGAVTGGSFTPATFSNATDMYADTVTVTTTLTAGAATVGGGFGATGCTFSVAGVLQCNGAATIGGAATITGALTLQSYAVTVSAPITVSGVLTNVRVLYSQIP